MISIRLDKAVTATTFDPIAEAIRFITGERADLGRIKTGSHRRSGRVLQAPEPLQTYRVRLGQFE